MFPPSHNDLLMPQYTKCTLHPQHGTLALQGVTDPEAKRKAIGAGFIRVFQHYADSFQANHGFIPKYLVQVGAGPVLLQGFIETLTMEPCCPCRLAEGGDMATCRDCP